MIIQMCPTSVLSLYSLSVATIKTVHHINSHSLLSKQEGKPWVSVYVFGYNFTAIFS